ncbi:MAG TPA: phosphate ABC transporter substrate-binding protein [Thermoanaerobaculia bacterium]|nr:phosphate ABC transporter substrate-binding protein [Thermoanaerobaculia bacterium]
MKRATLSVGLVAALILPAACGGERRQTAAGDTAGGRGSRTTVTIKGSDTMVILGQRFAEEYMKQNPGVVVQVNGGGSGTGIAALINGTVDLAQSSRPMRESEKADVEKRRNTTLNETPVALDALAVFVHDTNRVKALTLDQVAQIYTGKITNWSQVGGVNAPMVLYGRENSSGTYEYFKEHVLQKADFAPRVQTLAGTAAVINAVARDRNGIGYGGIAYAQGVRAIGISEDAKAAAVEPTEENVANGTYPVTRHLYFYWVAVAGPQVEQFVRWAASPEGQKVVENVGYFPLSGAPATMTQ